MIGGTSARVGASIQLQSTLSSQIATLQDQISTGKRLGNPADDPVAAAQVAQIGRAQADDTVYLANANLASATAARADSQMSSIGTALTRATSLLTNAANGTNSASDRSAFATELRGLATTVAQAAAVKDTDGQPLFPDAEPARIPIGPGNQVAPTVSKATLTGATAPDGSATDMAALLSAAADAIEGADNAHAPATASSYLTAVNAASTKLSGVQADQGVRAAAIDAQTDAIQTDQTALATRRSGLEDTDLSSAISLITSKMTTLQAAQAVFAKVNSRNLFDLLG